MILVMRHCDNIPKYKKYQQTSGMCGIIRVVTFCLVATREGTIFTVSPFKRVLNKRSSCFCFRLTSTGYRAFLPHSLSVVLAKNAPKRGPTGRHNWSQSSVLSTLTIFESRLLPLIFFLLSLATFFLKFLGDMLQLSWMKKKEISIFFSPVSCLPLPSLFPWCFEGASKI